LKAPPEEIISLLEKQDTFTHSIAVYTYDGSNIIEKQCENPGWPNVTHDGLVMYDNTFSTNKEEVVSWAKRSAKLGVKCTLERIKDVEEKLRTLRVQLDEYKSDQLKLDAKYQ